MVTNCLKSIYFDLSAMSIFFTLKAYFRCNLTVNKKMQPIVDKLPTSSPLILSQLIDILKVQKEN